MNNTQINGCFQDLCNILKLGEITAVPKPVFGGLLHKMYCLETASGKYAIKLLNPQIMKRQEAMQNYIYSEKISNLLSKYIPAHPAIEVDDTFVHHIKDQHYLVFHWVEGKNLFHEDLDITHCEKIGEILAAIHNMDFSNLPIKNDVSRNGEITDWYLYLQKGKEARVQWVAILEENVTILNDWHCKA